MAALQRFKLLAAQCGVAQSPTHSPRTSPAVVLRRRKTTLRMLLSRRSPRRREMPLPPSLLDKTSLCRKDPGRSLKDLFVSSPPFQAGREVEEKKPGFETRAFGSAGSDRCGGMRIGPGSTRPRWIGFRSRFLMRKAWRPVLIGIPE